MGDGIDASKSELRLALGQFATGVTIVTSVGANREPIGVTANSFNSVSLEPPMVLWSLSNSAYSRDAFESAEYFCVHVLTSEQQELSSLFACAGADKFANLNWSRGLGDVPLLKDYVARFQCRSTDRLPVGDHTVFVGEVLHYENRDKRPLVYHGGRYALAERRMTVDSDRGEDNRARTAAVRRATLAKRRNGNT